MSSIPEHLRLDSVYRITSPSNTHSLASPVLPLEQYRPPDLTLLELEDMFNSLYPPFATQPSLREEQHALEIDVGSNFDPAAPYKKSQLVPTIKDLSRLEGALETGIVVRFALPGRRKFYPVTAAHLEVWNEMRWVRALVRDFRTAMRFILDPRPRSLVAVALDWYEALEQIWWIRDQGPASVILPSGFDASVALRLLASAVSTTPASPAVRLSRPVLGDLTKLVTVMLGLDIMIVPSSVYPLDYNFLRPTRFPPNRNNMQIQPVTQRWNGDSNNHRILLLDKIDLWRAVLLERRPGDGLHATLFGSDPVPPITLVARVVEFASTLYESANLGDALPFASETFVQVGRLDPSESADGGLELFDAIAAHLLQLPRSSGLLEHVVRLFAVAMGNDLKKVVGLIEYTERGAVEMELQPG
ncbi:hypothetical protein JCM11491_005334 [Sporobolomyces phaffii]